MFVSTLVWCLTTILFFLVSTIVCPVSVKFFGFTLVPLIVHFVYYLLLFYCLNSSFVPPALHRSEKEGGRRPPKPSCLVKMANILFFSSVWCLLHLFINSLYL